MLEARCPEPDCGSIHPVKTIGSHLHLHSRFTCGACAYNGTADEAALHSLLSGHSAEWLSLSELTLPLLLLRVQENKSDGLLFRNTKNDCQKTEAKDQKSIPQPSPFNDWANKTAPGCSQLAGSAIKEQLTSTDLPETPSTKTETGASLPLSPAEYDIANVADFPLPGISAKDAKEGQLLEQDNNWNVQEMDCSANHESEDESENDVSFEVIEESDEKLGTTIIGDTSQKKESASDEKSRNSLAYCTKCERNIKQGRGGGNRNLLAHILTLPHGFPARQIVCSLCSETFTFLTNFYRHRKRHHTDKQATPRLLLSPAKVVAEFTAAFPSVDEHEQWLLLNRLEELAGMHQKNEQKNTLKSILKWPRKDDADNGHNKESAAYGATTSPPSAAKCRKVSFKEDTYPEQSTGKPSENKMNSKVAVVAKTPARTESQLVEICARCGANVSCRNTSHLFDHILAKSHGAFLSHALACSKCGQYCRSESGFRSHRKTAHANQSNIGRQVLLSKRELDLEIGIAFPALDEERKQQLLSHIRKFCA